MGNFAYSSYYYSVQLLLDSGYVTFFYGLIIVFLFMHLALLYRGCKKIYMNKKRIEYNVLDRCVCV